MRYKTKAMHYILCLALVCVVMPQLCAQTHIPPSLQKTVDYIVEPYLFQKNIAGLQIALLDGDAVFAFNYGNTIAERQSPPNDSTVYNIASLSKIYTTTLLAILHEKGIVCRDSSLAYYLPDSLVQQNAYWQSVSLRQLASHTAALPKDADNLYILNADANSPYRYYDETALIRFLAQYRPKKKIEDPPKFQYSDIGIALLAYALSRATQQPYEILLQTYLPSFARQQYLAAQPPLPDQPYVLAKGHSFGKRTLPVCTYNMLLGSKGLYSTLTDITALMQWYADTARAENRFLRTAMQPITSTPMKDVYISESWFVIKPRRRRAVSPVYTHSGRDCGYSHYIAFCPEKKIGVVMLSNSAVRVDETGIALLEMLFAAQERMPK